VFSCSSYNHPPKFWLAPNSGASLQSFTWWLHTLGFTTWARVSLRIHPACSFHLRFCMLMSKSCLWPYSGHAPSLRFVCTRCVRYENICHTHTRSHIYCCASIVMVDQRSITSVALVVHTISQSCWACVSGWFESSRRQVMWVCVCKITLHLSLVHTLGHFAKVLTTCLPSNSRTITPLSTRSIVTQKNAEAPSKSFQVALPASNSNNLHAGHPKSWTRQRPGTDCPIKLRRGCWPCPLCWLRKLRRQVGQTPSAHPCLLQKIAQFSSQSSWQLTDYSPKKLRSFHEQALFYVAVCSAQKLHIGDQQANLLAST